MKKLTFLYFASLIFLAFNVSANSCTGTVCTASSCVQSDVQATLNLVTASITEVDLPSCTSGGGTGWSSHVMFTAPSGSMTLTIKGQTTVSGTCAPGGSCTPTDSTIIIDNDATNEVLFQPNANSNPSSFIRVTGITIKGGTGLVKDNGLIEIAGSSQNVRVDHIHIDMTTYTTSCGSPNNPCSNAAVTIGGCSSGVADHSRYDAGANTNHNLIRIYNGGSCFGDTLGVGDQSWAHATGLGTSNFFFAENNEINGGAGNDCTQGGRFVWRYNLMNMNGSAPAIQTHPTGGGQRERGCRAWEIYGNAFSPVNLNPAPNYISTAFFLSSGTGVNWGNSYTSGGTGGNVYGFGSVINGHAMRSDNSTYAQSPTPAGWGYCGTAFNGTGSNWDGNTIASTGYPCIDQIGRGMGQLLVNDFPNALNNSTSTIAWPNQKLEPVYEWLSAYSPTPQNPSVIWSEAEAGRVNQNVDYYLGTTNTGSPITFTGINGVGAGTLPPTNSSAYSGAPNCTVGVAYWDSSNSTLYQCGPTANTWTAYYTPYTYPHPLDTGGVSISPTMLPGGTIGISYFQPLTATGGVSPYTWSVFSGSLPTNTSLNTSTGIISGTPSAAGTYSFSIKVTDSTSGTPLTATQPYVVTISGGAAPVTAPCTACISSNTSNGATFTKQIVPQPIGNWVGTYGIDGYVLAASTKSIPAYATFAAKSGTPFSWAPVTTDGRGLEISANSLSVVLSRIASCWYGQSDVFDIAITDGKSHPLEAYFCDWDGNGSRAETVTITDAVTGALLDSRNLTDFQGGLYLQWSISGHVHLNVTQVSGANAVIGGIFFS